ncbi:hypothetical protein [Streptomyces longispororuber]|uniref:hypothetical protein n=1 Tax=Streptomyces longispororuber TaxID=68230 RepID=UPI00210A5DA6|nr:hypothetical protein [Streptomyces longispororuber]MCQ4207929.1 hypothetical protein [Streptomyces longispororuber]
MTEVLTCRIAGTRNGPSGSANGGYACGLFARTAADAVGTAAVVQLHAAPPLDTELNVQAHRGRASVWHEHELVATVSAARHEHPATAPFVTVAAAQRAGAIFKGATAHPFPSCVVCGTARTDPAALHLTPGEVDGMPGVTACVWTPGDVDPDTVWAVLDCPGGWTLDQSGSPYVLGRMSARVHAVPPPGEPTVVVARNIETAGRTARVVSGLFGADGTELGRAEATWIRLSASSDPAPRQRELIPS